MSELEVAKRKTATTYNAAADFYDHPANTFWERYGRRTLERIGLTPGQRVLDVCCGSGASALPAARFVAPNGSVVGVDLAENLLALARDWWPMVMGSGYRGTLEQLAPEQREQVRKENIDFIRDTSLRSVEANVVYATAIKPSA